jgi:Autophagy protein 16 (ATG16)
LTTGLSLTVLEERAAKIEEENKSLLERWMVRIKAEAEKMNDANEFLEGIRGMRLESPVGGEEGSIEEKADSVS